MEIINFINEHLNVISLIASSIIGIIQINIARKQSKISKDLNEISIKINQSQTTRGINHNSNNGDISYNNLKS